MNTHTYSRPQHTYKFRAFILTEPSAGACSANAALKIQENYRQSDAAEAILVLLWITSDFGSPAYLSCRYNFPCQRDGRGRIRRDVSRFVLLARFTSPFWLSPCATSCSKLSALGHEIALSPPIVAHD